MEGTTCIAGKTPPSQIMVLYRQIKLPFLIWFSIIAQPAARAGS